MCYSCNQDIEMCDSCNQDTVGFINTCQVFVFCAEYLLDG